MSLFFLMEISLEGLSWGSSALKRSSRKKSLVERRGVTDFSVGADWSISEKLPWKRVCCRKQRVLSAALPQSLRAHPCSLCLPALLLSWAQFSCIQNALPVGNLHTSIASIGGAQVQLEQGLEQEGGSGDHLRSKILGEWIPATLKLLVFLAWQYSMQIYLKVLCFVCQASACRIPL